MRKKTNSKKFWVIFFSLLIFIISILFLISINFGFTYLIDDYETLRKAPLDLKHIIRLDFPAFKNPVGVFGVFFGHWIIYLFGRLLGTSIFLCIALLGLFNLFLSGDRKFLVKLVSFVVFAFFLNLLIFVARGAPTISEGYVPCIAYELFMRIFDRTGTFIITLIISLTCLVVIFEPENIFKFLFMILKSIYSLFLILFRVVFRRRTKKIAGSFGTARKRQNSILPPEERDSRQNIRITDHVIQKQAERENRIPNRPVVPYKKASPPDSLETKSTQAYRKPEIDKFLTSVESSRRDREEIEKNIKHVSKILEKKLAEFGVDAEVMNVNIGPIITQYEIKPAPGIKVSRFQNLADDLTLAIKATSIRVQAPIPGRGLVGIEIPNIKRDTIYLKDIMLSPPMLEMSSKLAIGLGKDIAGNPIVADLSQMPHLLIAGATGSGKSVCVNTIITCMLFRTTPEEVRFILIDPKRIELSSFEGIPHLIQSVVTNNDDALTALNWGVAEMERRYDLLQKYRVRNLAAYNAQINELKLSGEELEDNTLPYIIIVVDELADLMMTVGRDVERPITRLAQMARAIGIHLILATQRPSIKVITGIIKANFPSRIAFKVSTKIDSRVIIDANGAEKLLGLGDMLFLAPGRGTPQRIHGAYIPPKEIHSLVEYMKTQPKPEQEITIISEEDTDLQEYDYDDELFPEAAVAVVTAGAASVSMLQRHFKIGYARAGRLIDMLEQAGIIGPYVGSKSRDVIASEEDLKIYGYLKE
ncbi:MAG: cell division protein FtsK [Candidatus Cloacimonetes bacterium]|nr:cell division protein FtsK [Candidatus Cloacimonadota bacterium]